MHAGFTKLELGVRFIASKNAVGCVRGSRAEIAREKPGQHDNTTNREIPHCVGVIRAKMRFSPAFFLGSRFSRCCTAFSAFKIGAFPQCGILVFFYYFNFLKTFKNIYF